MQRALSLASAAKQARHQPQVPHNAKIVWLATPPRVANRAALSVVLGHGARVALHRV